MSRRKGNNRLNGPHWTVRPVWPVIPFPVRHYVSPPGREQTGTHNQFCHQTRIISVRLGYKSTYQKQNSFLHIDRPNPVGPPSIQCSPPHGAFPHHVSQSVSLSIRDRSRVKPHTHSAIHPSFILALFELSDVPNFLLLRNRYCFLWYCDIRYYTNCLIVS